MKNIHIESNSYPIWRKIIVQNDKNEGKTLELQENGKEKNFPERAEASQIVAISKTNFSAGRLRVFLIVQF